MTNHKKFYIVHDKVAGEKICGEISEDGGLDLNGISVEENFISISLIPEGFDLGPSAIQIKILPETVMTPNSKNEFPDLFDAIKDEIGTAFFDINSTEIPEAVRSLEVGPGKFVWCREVAGNGTPDKYLTVYIVVPKDLFHYAGASIYGSVKNGELVRTYGTDEELPPQGGEAPDEKNDVFPYERRVRTRQLIPSINGTIMIPGEQLSLAWVIKSAINAFSNTMESIYFDTPVFGGGLLVGSSGEGESIVWHVEAYGQEFTFQPTDFADYNVGDWIFFVKQGDAGAEQTDRVKEYGSEDQEVEDDSAYRLLPADFNSFGNENGEFDKLNFLLNTQENFSRHFESNLFYGVIVSVDVPNDEADIIIEGIGSFEGVSIFYHCQSADSVVGGSTAFAEDDEVLVINEGGSSDPTSDDLVIVGFVDQLKACCIWHEEWDGPLLDSKHPWIHTYFGYAYDYYNPPTYTTELPNFPDNIEIDLHQCPTESTEQSCSYIDIYHPEEPGLKWHYDPELAMHLDGYIHMLDLEAPDDEWIHENAKAVIFNVEIDPDDYPRYDTGREVFLIINGEDPDGNDIELGVIAVNTWSTGGEPQMYGYDWYTNEPVRDEVDWGWYDYFPAWVRTVGNNKTTPMNFPVDFVKIKRVRIKIQAYSKGYIKLAPIRARINHIGFC